MIEQAAEDMNLDLDQSWMIGDQLRDIETGYRANVKTILLHAKPESLEFDNEQYTPDFISKDLYEAAKVLTEYKDQAFTESDTDSTLNIEISDLNDNALVEATVGTSPDNATEEATVDSNDTSTNNKDSKPHQPEPESEPESSSSDNQIEIKSEDLPEDDQTLFTHNNESALTQPEKSNTADTSIANTTDDFSHQTKSTKTKTDNTPTSTTPLSEQSNIDLEKQLLLQHETVELLDKIHRELAKDKEPNVDFAIAKMIAGIFQMLVIGCMVLGLLSLWKNSQTGFTNWMTGGILLQLTVIALLMTDPRKR